MIKGDVKELIGKFGELTTANDQHKKTIPGVIRDMDIMGKVWFVDNDSRGYVFSCDDIESFVLKDFESLPNTHNGKDIYWSGGVACYTGTTKEVNLNK